MKKLLVVIFIGSILVSAGFLCRQYSEVHRWQKKGIVSYINKIVGDSPPQHEVTKQQQPIGKMPQPAPCPEWLLQSPVSIAVGLWISMAANIATLGMSFLSALFMFISYRKSKEPSGDNTQ